MLTIARSFNMVVVSRLYKLIEWEGFVWRSHATYVPSFYPKVRCGSSDEASPWQETPFSFHGRVRLVVVVLSHS